MLNNRKLVDTAIALGIVWGFVVEVGRDILIGAILIGGLLLLFG